MNTGWLCPRCNRSNAPTIAECPCSPAQIAITQPSPNLNPPCPRCGQIGLHACATWFYTPAGMGTADRGDNIASWCPSIFAEGAQLATA